jgi:phage terminase small subunit
MVDINKPLEGMQLRFVSEFLADSSSARAAAVRAGYSIKTVDQAASRLMADPRIQEAIQIGYKAAGESLGITPERILQELWKIAGANPGDTVTLDLEGEAVLNPRGAGELTVTTMSGDSKKVKSVTAKTVKPSDKINALEKIGKLLNLFPKEDAIKIELSLTELIEKSMEEAPQAVSDDSSQ